MKLEYLATGLPECPLLRFYQFTPAEAAELRAAVLTLVDGTATTVTVHQLPFIQAVEGCELTLVVKKWDQGVARAAGPLAFTFGLTLERWQEIAKLLEPFVRLATGYQWLQTSTEECSVLLSATGTC
jgi:hypothetical protein